MTGIFAIIATNRQSVFATIAIYLFAKFANASIMSSLQDEQRRWLIDQLNSRGRGARGMLATFLGLRNDAITRITNLDGKKEAREISLQELIGMADFFGVEPPGLTAAKRNAPAADTGSNPNETEQPFVKQRPAEFDFAVYASAEGGPGEIIRSAEPVDFIPRPLHLLHVRDAYGLLVTGHSMEPEYKNGEMAIVEPSLPVVPNEVCIFYAERNGEARATIKHLRRQTADRWLVSQHNPPDGVSKDFSLSRREWAVAHRVTGKRTRR